MRGVNQHEYLLKHDREPDQSYLSQAMAGGSIIPIDELLNRIRWDPSLARSNFQLGYYDRVENQIILVPFQQVSFPEDAPNWFQLVDADERVHRIPFHRVREVYQDGQCIWRRPRR